MVLYGITYEKCSICGIMKELSEFHRSSCTRDGLKCACKACRNAETTARQIQRRALEPDWYEKRKRQRAEWQRNKRATDPVYKARVQRQITILNKERLKRDPIFRMRNNIKGRLGGFIRYNHWSKQQAFSDKVGCSAPELRVYIEKLFKPGMTWDNYGRKGWHIDHIIPLSSASSMDELYKLCHYTNLQPLWASENQSKGNK